MCVCVVLQSTSRWKLLLKESTLHRGVKRGTSIPDLTSVYDLNYDMWALEPKYCVNPRDITTVPLENEPIKMERCKDVVFSVQGQANSQQSPLLSYCRTAVKRESVRSPVLSRSVKNEEDTLSQSSCALQNNPSIAQQYCRTAVKREAITHSPAILSRPVKSETDALSQSSCALLLTNQSIVQPFAIKSENLNLYRANTNPIITCSVKSEEAYQTDTKPSVLTTDLENFQDLTAWCRQTPKAPNMAALRETDELNTPLIEFGEEFLFTSPTILNAHNNITTDDDDCYGLFNVAATPGLAGDFYACADIQLPTTIVHDTDDKYNNSDNSSTLLFECNPTATTIIGDNNVFNTTNAEYQQYSSVYINDIGGGEVPENIKTNNVLNLISNSTTTDSYNHNLFTSTTTKCVDTLYNNATTENHQQQQQQQQLTEEVEQVFTMTPVLTPSAANGNNPEMSFQFNGTTTDSVSGFQPVSSSETSDGRKNLRLDFSNLWMGNKPEPPTIDTPEVINTALAMDKDGFNLLKFIENDSFVSDDLPPNVARPEDDADDQSETPSASNDPTYTTTDVSDDEDYEPPWKKRGKLVARSAKKPNGTRRTSTSTRLANSTVDFSSVLSLKHESYDSEVSNVSTVESVKVVRRGRPPKRNISISSESTNADNDVSRYRELRDKNNEASRRSRLNRKMKEQNQEQEAQDLEKRNRKLKVRVAELDKLVNTMRNNLMQMLLKK